ncbi:uncharacterized protein LOC142351861 [Convolutriloba macropyga]|uniref:uncharacterized protein LOC142351861 n=1 Tax=Convolutriloba macropyga TaxID=536237 RepID=UPI003F51ADD7
MLFRLSIILAVLQVLLFLANDASGKATYFTLNQYALDEDCEGPDAVCRNVGKNYLECNCPDSAPFCWAVYETLRTFKCKTRDAYGFVSVLGENATQLAYYVPTVNKG